LKTGHFYFGLTATIFYLTKNSFVVYFTKLNIPFFKSNHPELFYWNKGEIHIKSISYMIFPDYLLERGWTQLSFQKF